MRVVHLLDSGRTTHHPTHEEELLAALLGAQRTRGEIVPEFLAVRPTSFADYLEHRGFPVHRIYAPARPHQAADIYGVLRYVEAHPKMLLHAHGSRASLLVRGLQLFGAPLAGAVISYGSDDPQTPALKRTKFWSFVTSGLGGVTTRYDPLRTKQQRVGKKPLYIPYALPVIPPASAEAYRAARYLYGWPDKVFVVAFCDSFVKQHGVAEFLDAAEFSAAWGREDLLWVIAGDGPRDLLVEEAVQRIPYLVALPHPHDIEAFFAGVDMFVQSSSQTAHYHGLLRAMQAQKPIAATRVGTTDLVVRDGYEAMVIEPRDSPAITAAVVRFADDRAYAERLAAAAHQRFLSEYTSSAQELRFAQIYRNVLQHT